MDGERLKLGVGKEQVEPTDPRHRIGIAKVSTMGAYGIASSSESLMTCTFTSEASILTVGCVGT